MSVFIFISISWQQCKNASISLPLIRYGHFHLIRDSWVSYSGFNHKLNKYLLLYKCCCLVWCQVRVFLCVVVRHTVVVIVTYSCVQISRIFSVLLLSALPLWAQLAIHCISIDLTHPCSMFPLICVLAEQNLVLLGWYFRHLSKNNLCIIYYIKTKNFYSGTVYFIEIQ